MFKLTPSLFAVVFRNGIHIALLMHALIEAATAVHRVKIWRNSVQ